MNTNVDADAIMNDPEEWDVPSRPKRSKSEQRQRGAVVSVRLTPAELEAVTARAESVGLAVSSYMRSCALGDAPGYGVPAMPFQGSVLVYGGERLGVAVFSANLKGAAFEGIHMAPNLDTIGARARGAADWAGTSLPRP